MMDFCMFDIETAHVDAVEAEKRQGRRETANRLAGRAAEDFLQAEASPEVNTFIVGSESRPTSVTRSVAAFT